MKDYLLNQIKKLNERKSSLNKAMIKEDNAEERATIGATLEALEAEIKEAKDALAKLDEEGTNETEETETEGRSFSPIKTLLNGAKPEEKREEDKRGTMEYRKAFMNYVQRGVVSDVLETRDDVAGTASDLGVLLPTTVMQEIIKGVEKVYGQLYSRVRKLNLKGGVKFPIGSFGATFKRITESTVSDRQKGGSITGSVEFTYNIGEVRVAQTLLQTILSVDVFETEFAKVIVEAYVKACDTEIMTGDASKNEFAGILTEANKSSGSRIDAANIIEFTDAEMADWTSWQKKLFAKIPLSMRSLRPEFVMTANTYEANIETLKDGNDQPVAREIYNPVNGDAVCKFKGRDVVLVEEDILKNFNDATNGEYFGMYWVPEKAYAINTNLEFYVVEYFDHETNQKVKKAIVINDGKILDPKYIYLLKKKVSA